MSFKSFPDIYLRKRRLQWNFVNSILGKCVQKISSFNGGLGKLLIRQQMNVTSSQFDKIGRFFKVLDTKSSPKRMVTFWAVL